MSFKCEQCRQSQPTRSHPITVVTERREKIYPPQEHKRKDGKWWTSPGGVGWEIAREMRVCKACAAEMQG